MNNVDWGLYDTDATSRAPLKKTKSTKISSDANWDVYDPPQKLETTFLEDVGDYAKTTLKGGIEGLTRAGQMFGPLDTGISKNKALEQQTETLDQLLPTDEGFTQSALRRGLREAPSMLAFPGASASMLPRSIAAGFLGEAGKELGLPEWGQTALELTAFIGPDITKKLIETGNNKELIEYGKKFGFSDKELTPLLQSDFKKKWLSKLAPKRGATQEALKATHARLKDSYKAIQKSETALQPVSESISSDLTKKLEAAFDEMPSAVKNLVKEDYQKLLEKPMTADSIMNFYADVSHYFSPQTKQLSILKEPIKEAIRSVSPELGKDFDMINKLYSKYYDISAKLKPDLVSDLVTAGEILGITGSIVTGHYPTLISILGERAGKKLAQQMLINPHLQQLGEKIGIALNEGKYGIAAKLIQGYANKIFKSAPEASNELMDITEKRLKDYFLVHKNGQNEESE